MTRDRASSGMVIALCGPDGTGKSTLAEFLHHHVGGPVLQIHHKPEFLPYPRPDEARDFTRPYAVAKRSRAESILKIVYLYLDWLLAWFFRIGPWRRRGGYVIIQRPWLDMVVDPDRYRLDVPEWLVRNLHNLLPNPDLTVLLQASPDVIASRKGELSLEQIETQTKAWRRELEQTENEIVIDVSGGVDDTGRELLAVVEETQQRSQPDLLSTPGGRWLVPRRPRRAAAAGIRLFHPVDRRGRFVSTFAGLGARSGMFRLAPKTQPPEALSEVLARWLQPGYTFAARKLRDGQRWFVLIIDESGETEKAIKIGLTTPHRAAIEAEKRTMGAVEPLLPSPLAVPTLHDSALGSIVSDPVAWSARKRPLTLPPVVAAGLGALFSRSAGDSDALRGRVHGDLAPWNILWDGREWFLIDWEESRPDGEPFHDIFHFYVQGHTLLSTPSAKAIVDGLTSGKGPVGESIAAFAEGAGIPADIASEHFDSYLATSIPDRDDSDSTLRTALERRDDLWLRWRDRAGWQA